jgi:hypothetical protein
VIERETLYVVDGLYPSKLKPLIGNPLTPTGIFCEVGVVRV